MTVSSLIGTAELKNTTLIQPKYKIHEDSKRKKEKKNQQKKERITGREKNYR